VLDVPGVETLLRLTRFVRETLGLVLDLSGVHFLCARGISVLNTLDKECRTAGTYWVIVGSPFVERLLHIGPGGSSDLPGRFERRGSTHRRGK
jgi:hypothetical protein